MQSRYYDPNTGRMLNADDTDMLSDHNDLVETNLFAYVLNNPVNKADNSGNFAIALPVVLIGAIALTVVATAAYFYSTPAGQRSWNGLGHTLSNAYTSKINYLRRSWNSLVVHARAYGRIFVAGNLAGYNIAFKYARNKGAKGRPKLKKQGREGLEKKKGNPNYRRNQNKRQRTQPRPHHPSKKGHRKYP